MRLNRVFTDQPLVVGAETTLPEAAGGHVARVLRLKAGAPLKLFDGSGADFAAEIVAVDGDRVRVRIGELRASIHMVRRLLADLPAGETLVPLPAHAGEGSALVEGFRGECLAWLRLDDGGLIRGAFLRDPSWLQWPLLEAAIEGNIVADFPLCNKSFNCSYSGVDL